MGIGTKEPLKSMADETARRDKVTFLISSHDLSLFSNLADSCLLLFHGRIVCRTGGKNRRRRKSGKSMKNAESAAYAKKERQVFYSGALEKERICVSF